MDRGRRGQTRRRILKGCACSSLASPRAAHDDHRSRSRNANQRCHQRTPGPPPSTKSPFPWSGGCGGCVSSQRVTNGHRVQAGVNPQPRLGEGFQPCLHGRCREPPERDEFPGIAERFERAFTSWECCSNVPHRTKHNRKGDSSVPSVTSSRQTILRTTMFLFGSLETCLWWGFGVEEYSSAPLVNIGLTVTTAPPGPRLMIAMPPKTSLTRLLGELSDSGSPQNLRPPRSSQT